MDKFKSFLFYYNWGLISLILISGLISHQIFLQPIVLLMFVPLIIYFWGFLIINVLKKSYPSNQYFWITVSLLVFLNLIFTSILAFSNIYFSQKLVGYVFSIFYLPLPVYFILTIVGWYQKIQKINHHNKPIVATIVTPSDQHVLDKNRRQFLKLVGSAGISVFLLGLLNPKQASAAFFGSVPGPGVVSLKDASGIKINPAEKQPTDGYKISQVDDNSSPAYYGYVNASGSWYIMSEDSSSNYRYTKGDSSFSTNWTDRASLTYGLFDSVF